MKSFKKLLAVMSSAAIAASVLTAIPASAEESTPTKFDVTKAMGVGWNLGNSLDAVGNFTKRYSNDSKKYNTKDANGNYVEGWDCFTDISSETVWGNPKTTKELIDRKHKANVYKLKPMPAFDPAIEVKADE